MRNTGINPKTPVDWVLTGAEFVLLSLQLRLLNRKSTDPVIGDGDANVSLTSYGKRISSVWQTIETIGLGTVKPHRLILWLDDDAVVTDPPAPLRRLLARGLEIRHCRDYGPHKKYFPYVDEVLHHESERLPERHSRRPSPVRT